MKPITNFLLLILLTCNVGNATEITLRSNAAQSLENSTKYLVSISTKGGYLWNYSTDLSLRAGELEAEPGQIWVQKPGTPIVGHVFLNAFKATGNAIHLDAARSAARVLADNQLESGGWFHYIETDETKRLRFHFKQNNNSKHTSSGKRINTSSYDDENTQNVLLFFIDYCDTVKGIMDNRDISICDAANYGLSKLLQAQYPNGAWPQKWNGINHEASSYPISRANRPDNYPRKHVKSKYQAAYTLNDGSHESIINVLACAWLSTGEVKYKNASIKAGDFLLRAQMPSPQPIWAQQYNQNMEPTWARPFEPPAVTSAESVSALRALLTVYSLTHDKKYLEAIDRAVTWFDSSKISDKTWSRFYELNTNIPIYGDHDGNIHYHINEISNERRHGYQWSGNFGYDKFIATLAVNRSPESYDKAGTRHLCSGTENSKPRVSDDVIRRIISKQKPSGVWLTNGAPKNRRWPIKEHVSLHEITLNMRQLTNFLLQ
ncbi:MAG: pectate lyase [Pseudomonadota bacterium]|nr:pectate lyase [Pseudomonadota bacterium]MDP2351055.1 pectate lyase [Pseudomonadota bacterium]